MLAQLERFWLQHSFQYSVALCYIHLCVAFVGNHKKEEPRERVNSEAIPCRNWRKPDRARVAGKQSSLPKK